MSSSRAGGGSGSAAIPAHARKTVQSLKEVVQTSEDEIYAVLKECNMDPNETVQRLLNQDPFHEVKRKRDKKKEWNKDGNDTKGRPASGGSQTRGGRGERSFGRGGSLSRHGSSEFNGGRGKSFVAKENGSVNTNPRVASTSGGLSSSAAPSSGQGKTTASVTSINPVPASTTPSPGLQNGSPALIRPGSWGAGSPGHATMADVVKANGTPLPPPGLNPALSTISVGVPVSTSAAQPYIMSGTSAIPASSGVYSSSTDPVLHPSLDARATGTPGAIKREIGTVGNHRTKGDWSSSSRTMDSLSSTPMSSQSLPTQNVTSSLDRDTQVTRPSSPPVAVSSPGLQERLASHSVADNGNSVGSQGRHGTGSSATGAPGSRTQGGVGPFSSRPAYLSQLHPVGTQKASGLEWKPKIVVQSPGTSMVTANVSPPPESTRPTSPSLVSADSGNLSADSGNLSAATSKLQSVTIRDDQPVIIPNHIQAAEAENLSFGSFGAGFGSGFSSNFVPKDSNKVAASADESTPVTETPMEPPSTSSVATTASLPPSQNFLHQPASPPEEVLTATNESASVSLPPMVLQSELPKPDPVGQQGPHYPYLPAIPNYPGFNVMQQVPVAQFAYETSETQTPDVGRLPSLVPYTDPAGSYYTPLFRGPGTDGDARYPFVTSNATSKYNGNMGLVNLSGQTLPSQEGGNSVLPQVPASQTSQAGNGQTVPTVPQQPLPLHAYTGQPGGAPLGHHFGNVFGYQYIPPSYAYMPTHSPYQHNYTTNSVYPQAPSGSTYPNAAASTYPPGGATAVKYQLPQYKPANAAGIAPHSAAAAGYGGYSSAPSGYAANPTVTVGSTTGYEDVQQYKDNMYIPTQQVEGSTVWIQAPLSRDMQVGGMQASSYYNMPAQGQHGAYAHAQQPSHGHTHPNAYASLYHPSQSGQAPAAHQLLQQPQSLAGGGSQAGGYQQPQRNQQTWTNTY